MKCQTFYREWTWSLYSPYDSSSCYFAASLQASSYQSPSVPRRQDTRKTKWTLTTSMLEKDDNPIQKRYHAESSTSGELNIHFPSTGRPPANRSLANPSRAGANSDMPASSRPNAAMGSCAFSEKRNSRKSLMTIARSAVASLEHDA